MNEKSSLACENLQIPRRDYFETFVKLSITIQTTAFLHNKLILDIYLQRNYLFKSQDMKIQSDKHNKETERDKILLKYSQ